MSTVRERLLAGEHHGCATWQDVANRFGVDDRRLRVVRAALRMDGIAVELKPAVDSAFQENIGKADKWASVAAFDSQFANGESSGEEPGCTPVGAVATNYDVVPPHHAIKGVSSFVVDGEVRGQWIKTTAVNDERAQWIEAMRSLADTLPRVEPVSSPEYTDDDLLVVLPVGDPHVGLLAWHEDSGENFDLEIAERNLIAAFQNLIDRAPAASRCLIVFIGDNTHSDGQSNTTTKGTRVDVDGRTVKMARTNINIMRRANELALRKFKHVTDIIERGNHDELIAALTSMALGMFYENEPRVTVDQSPEMYHWYRFGQNLIGTHHGDKAKPMDLLGVMAVDRQQDWGETTHRRFYCGHFHHQIVKEVPGLIVEYLPTLASSDAWHRSMGYRSQRAMYMDVFHREWGHINRHIVGIQQLRGVA